MKITFIADYADGIHKNRALDKEWQEDIFVAGMITDRDAEQAAKEIVESFNNTLRAGEQPRKFIRIVEIQPLDRCSYCRAEIECMRLGNHESQCRRNPDNLEAYE